MIEKNSEQDSKIWDELLSSEDGKEVMKNLVTDVAKELSEMGFEIVTDSEKE